MITFNHTFGGNKAKNIISVFAGVLLLFVVITVYGDEPDTIPAGEMEARYLIHMYVQKRTNIEIDDSLDRIPGKFRFSEMYQIQRKKVEQQQLTYKQQLRRYHAELDSLADKYRKTAARTPSGIWKLTEFYNGFDVKIPVDYKKYWDLYIENIEDWANEYPDSPTPRIALASILINRAWAYRTGLPAKEVDAKAWKTFNYYISQAKLILEGNKPVASKDPHWYALMTTVATAESWDLAKFLRLIDEGTSKYPYYYQIYFRGINYLLPRWHGGFDQMEAFANAAVKKTKSKEKMAMYARIYWAASGVYGKRLFLESKVNWNNMRQGMIDVLNQYPDSWNINNFAYFSCFAKDKETAKKLTGMIKQPLMGVWEAQEVFDACKNWTNGKDAGLLEMIMPGK